MFSIIAAKIRVNHISKAIVVKLISKKNLNFILKHELRTMNYVEH